jgi:hypothetical protein
MRRACPSVCRSSCKRMWLRPADIAVRHGFPHRDVRGGLGHTTFETACGSLSRRSAQQCSKSRHARAQQMHPHTTRRLGAHTVCRNSSHAGGTPPHATQASRVELLVDTHGEPHVELDDVRLLVVTGGVAGELEDLGGRFTRACKPSPRRARHGSAPAHDVPATALLLHTTSQQLSMICDACRCLTRHSKSADTSSQNSPPT